MDRIVKETQGAYERWYFANAVCGCNNGAPICPKHEWEREMLPRLQAMINSAPMTLAVPRMAIKEQRPMPQIPEGHPMEMEPVLRWVKAGSHAGRFAAAVARYLADMGHAVFYLNKTTALSTAYDKKDGMVRDAMLSAPVLVYHENDDRRQNGWIIPLVYSRQYGICVVIHGGNDKAGDFTGVS